MGRYQIILNNGTSFLTNEYAQDMGGIQFVPIGFSAQRIIVPWFAIGYILDKGYSEAKS